MQHAPHWIHDNPGALRIAEIQVWQTLSVAVFLPHKQAENLFSAAPSRGEKWSVVSSLGYEIQATR